YRLTSDILSVPLRRSVPRPVLLSVPTRRSSDLARVMGAVVVSPAWALPAGVWIGRSPRLARALQPVIQVVASFPGCSARASRGRSEEHTSELQSRFDLVCRLLLEKKKNQTHTTA